MCLSVPAKIVSMEGDMAQVSIGGTMVQTGLQLIENPQIGDFVLVHSGFAISKISEEEANETMRLLHELDELEDEIDKTEGKVEF